jgi:hypothetical protein
MGRLSNPPEQVETLVGEGVSDTPRNRNGRSRSSQADSKVSESPIREEKGRLSNPRQYSVQRRLDPGEVDRLVEGYEAGQSLEDLARLFRIHSRTVAAQLEKRGIPRRVNQVKLTGAKVTEASDRYKKGASLAELGWLFGVDPATVRRALLRAGVKFRSRR